jgi:penicillin-binding protein 2
MDLHDAVVQSCDVYFYELAHQLGIEYMHDFLVDYGFSRKTGIDLHGESSALVPNREWKKKYRDEPWYPGETVIAGIGQGYMLATPLQLASATTAIANAGKRMQPHLLKGIEDPLTRERIANTPQQIGNAVASPGQLAVIESSMIDVTHGARGTARRIGLNSPYKIAAKTGTAQVIGIAQNERYNEEEVALRHRDHALFIAYAPAEQPRIAVAVIAENGGHGGSTAGPIARKVMDYYLLGELPAEPEESS